MTLILILAGDAEHCCCMLTAAGIWTGLPVVTRGVAFSSCLLDADYGLSCRSANETAWFYNRTSGACEQFVFGGCLGNQNRFLSQSICHSVCVLRTIGPTYMPPVSPYPTPQVPVRSTQNFGGRTPPAGSISPMSPSPTQTSNCAEVDCADKDCSVGGFATDDIGCPLCICVDPCEVSVAVLDILVRYYQ